MKYELPDEVMKRSRLIGFAVSIATVLILGALLIPNMESGLVFIPSSVCLVSREHCRQASYDTGRGKKLFESIEQGLSPRQLSRRLAGWR